MVESTKTIMSSYANSITGVNHEIGWRQNYITLVRKRTADGFYLPYRTIETCLKYNKEINKLKKIRLQLWLIVITEELLELA